MAEGNEDGGGGRQRKEAPIKVNDRAETRDVPEVSAVDAKLDVGLSHLKNVSSRIQLSCRPIPFRSSCKARIFIG
jgi:hypothetical protein